MSVIDLRLLSGDGGAPVPGGRPNAEPGDGRAVRCRAAAPRSGAALIYLHGSDARQRAIAEGLSRLVEGELQGRIQERPKRARRRGHAAGHVSNRGHHDGASGAGPHAG